MLTIRSQPTTDQAFSRRLRVASVYRNFNRAGSIESLFLRNAERLAEDEDLTLFTAASTRAATSAPLRFAEVESMSPGRGRLRYAVECSSFARRATRALSIRRQDFDVVHVEGFAAYDADLVTVHAVRAAEQEHYFTHIEPDAWLRRWLSPHVFRPQNRVVMRIEKRLFEKQAAPYCICPSSAVKRDLERWHGVPSDRIQVLPYGMDLQRFRHDATSGARLRAELGTSRDTFVLLFVGSPFERKGLDVAIAGFLRADLPDAELWVVGGDERERKAVLRRRLDGRVRLLGRRSPDEIPAFYSAADALVLPTQQDSWAIPVMEALAARCPVITSEFSGSCELVEHGVNGFVMRGRGDPAELAAILTGPFADRTTRRQIGARGFEAVAPYGYENFYRAYRAAHHHAFELARERRSTS
jgi:glycosyltransferase involved in cell wall biosynthesis